jgi:basic amino acid/polyamine antiporter, APA family
MHQEKHLRLLDVVCISVGAMLSSGLFILPGLAHAQVGDAVILSYFLAAILATVGMLCQAELASAMPKTGGTYFYVTRSMGPAVGTVYGLITVLALALKSSFELIGMAAYTAPFVDIDIRLLALVLCVCLLAANMVGAKVTGRVQVVLVFAILAALGIYVIKGLPEVQIQHFGYFPSGDNYLGVLATAGFVFVSYGGLLKVASIAEEVQDAGRILPKAMVISLGIVILCYTLVIVVTTGVLPDEVFEHSLTPIPDGAAVFLGEWGAILLSIAAILAFASAANAGILGASRYPLALSRDQMLPEKFGEMHPRFGTPYQAILLVGILMICALFLNIQVIIKAASAVLILTYIFPCLAIIIMRESRLQNYQPVYAVPWYPWLPIAGVIGFSAILISIGKEAMIVAGSLLLGGWIIYWFYGRIRATREYALMHLVERITATELTDHSLETELKDIVRERDDIMKDRFDHMIEACPVIDINGSMSMAAFFSRAAEAMADHLHMDQETLLNRFLQREKESSTVLSPFLAIPHIIISGEKEFDILLARSKEGIEFPGASPNVHAVFLLVGSKDERSFHLRSLAAIAQIVQDRNFEKQWIQAKNEEVLRDIVLLGKRRRH